VEPFIAPTMAPPPVSSSLSVLSPDMSTLVPSLPFQKSQQAKFISLSGTAILYTSQAHSAFTLQFAKWPTEVETQLGVYSQACQQYVCQRHLSLRLEHNKWRSIIRKNNCLAILGHQSNEWENQSWSQWTNNQDSPAHRELHTCPTIQPYNQSRLSQPNWEDKSNTCKVNFVLSQSIDRDAMPKSCSVHSPATTTAALLHMLVIFSFQSLA
jgi:hypothetical protein